MIISIASGKGGTGKTTVAVNIAQAMSNCQFLDCDVEEPNAHIFLNPENTKAETVYSDIPLIDNEKCNHCGICAEACKFNALVALPKHIIFFSELCMSCYACKEMCPEGAIAMIKKEVGSNNKDHCRKRLGRPNRQEEVAFRRHWASRTSEGR